MKFNPLPTKSTTSFDIPKLMLLLSEGGVFYTDTEFKDLLVIRSWISRHNPPYRLKQEKVQGGYGLSLVPKE